MTGGRDSTWFRQTAIDMIDLALIAHDTTGDAAGGLVTAIAALDFSDDPQEAGRMMGHLAAAQVAICIDLLALFRVGGAEPGDVLQYLREAAD